MAYPRRIAGPETFEYQRLYMFYQRLEQRERLRRIPSIISVALAVSVPIMLTVCAWAYTHPVQPRQVAASSTVVGE